MRTIRSSKTAVLAAAAAAVVLAATSCSSSGGGTSSSSSSSYNAGITGVVNPSTHAGGTVAYQLSSTPDSMDPGNTYYAFMWDFSRLYARALTTFTPAPGTGGLKLVPDLATGLGTPSDGGKTWTYHIRTGLKFSDGTPITTADVKYAIERSNYAPDVLSNGPTYFHQYLVDNSTPYPGPYKDKTGGLDSIQTPDTHTIVFHLKQPFADFDYLVSNPQTAPVPAAKDTGASYVNNIVSSGSYMFSSYTDGKGATLVKNPNWSAGSDPLRKQYPDKITIDFNIAQTTVDQNLIAGNTTLDMAGAGMAAATQATALSNPSQKSHIDDAQSGALAYVAISTNVAPFNNIHCRQAVEYAIDKTSVQTATGGDVHGDIASTVLPPTVNGYTQYPDQYPTPGNAGADSTQGLNSAKQQLSMCGMPNGFTTNLSARSDRPNEIAMAQAIQASLKKVGINVDIQQYPSGKYFTDNAGAPAFVHSHDLGLMMMAWAADWPTGYGFLEQILDGATIKASGNSNLSELNDPNINQMLSSAIQNTDESARLQAWGTIDKAAMQQAAIVPLLYRKDLLYRPAAATNIYVTEAYGMYDYLNVGSTK
ncbi:ABC transporter substrate-binding protein [Streptacidiphilus jiangxiensis]|uniref:Peptide/nickel transport system substrate-binding protein n=1 Tax=Streptacidiphilus jiangxiensis TaxID=235985 RepID=A0A1H7TNK5_STRJI|nr:ABC transporter substrate-binding protein [Streptacidiphilus jiangxiensis]SEL86452.1 peptide/nickel transport system substrate-binding protein [Streptacidiphilus jiangxiensis]